jgi:hypothetical protein
LEDNTGGAAGEGWIRTARTKEEAMTTQTEQTLVSNEVYDLLMATASKLEGLAAYNKYQRDGNGQIWQQLRQQDEQAVRQLLQQIEQFAQQGKLKTK